MDLARICMSAATSTICLGSRERFESRVTHFMKSLLLKMTLGLSRGDVIVIDTEIS